MWSGGEHPGAGQLKGGRDAVSDTSDFVDEEELTEHADEISAFHVVMDDLLPAVQQGLCRAPCSTDVARHLLQLRLDVISA